MSSPTDLTIDAHGGHVVGRATLHAGAASLAIPIANLHPCLLIGLHPRGSMDAITTGAASPAIPIANLYPCLLIGLHHTWEHGCYHKLVQTVALVSWSFTSCSMIVRLFTAFVSFASLGPGVNSSKEDAHVLNGWDGRANKRPWKHDNTLNATFS